MQLTIERAALLKALAHVQSVVERRNTIPILSNVLIEAAEVGLSLTATDMDLTVVEQVPAEIGQAGATTVAAHTLYDIVRKLPDGAQVSLTTAEGGNQTNLTAGRSTFTLQSLPRDDFPAAGGGDLPLSFTLSAGDLKTLIDRTRFAISTEETRYYLNGIYLHSSDSDGRSVLRAVATDGHRLARFEMPLPEGAGEMPGVIVPRKTVGELHKLIEESDASVVVELSETRIRFAFDSTVLTSKLIDGTFPDYARVIPTGNDKQLSVDRRSFSAAVDRVSTISTEKSRAVKLVIADGTMTLTANSPDAGSAEEAIEIDYGGPSVEIGFNSRYLLDVAQQIEGEQAVISLSDSASPTVVQESGGGDALYVLMPMRV